MAKEKTIKDQICDTPTADGALINEENSVQRNCQSGELISASDACQILGLTSLELEALAYQEAWTVVREDGCDLYRRWDLRWHQIQKYRPVDIMAPREWVCGDHVAALFDVCLQTAHNRAKREGWPSRLVGKRLSFDRTAVERSYDSKNIEDDLLSSYESIERDGPEYISVEAGAKMLGIKRSTLYKLVENRLWKSSGAGRRKAYIRRLELQQLLDEKGHRVPEAAPDGFDYAEQIAERYHVGLSRVKFRAREEKWSHKRVAQRWCYARQDSERSFEASRLEDNGEYIDKKQVCKVLGIKTYRVLILCRQFGWRTLMGLDQRLLYNAEDVRACLDGSGVPEGYISEKDIAGKYQAFPERIHGHIRNGEWKSLTTLGGVYYAETDVEKTYAYMAPVREGKYLTVDDAADLLEVKAFAIRIMARNEDWAFLQGEGGERYYLTADILRYREATTDHYSIKEIMLKYGLKKRSLMRIAGLAQWRFETRRRTFYYLRSDVNATLGGINEAEKKDFVSLGQASADLNIPKTKFKDLAKQLGIAAVMGRDGVLYYRSADVDSCRAEIQPYHLDGYLTYQEVAELWGVSREYVLKCSRKENWQRVRRAGRLYVRLEDAVESERKTGEEPKMPKASIIPDGYITAVAAGQIIGITRAGVYVRAKKEAWETTRVGKLIFFAIESVERSKKRQAKR